MNPPSVDIKDWLIDSAGLGYTFGTDIFIGEIPPNKEDNSALITDTGGFSPDLHIDYFKPTVQIIVRDSSYPDGYTRAEAIVSLLRTKHNETINGTRYIILIQTGDINYIGRDENKRYLFSMNYTFHRTNT